MSNLISGIGFITFWIGVGLFYLGGWGMGIIAIIIAVFLMIIMLKLDGEWVD